MQFEPKSGKVRFALLIRMSILLSASDDLLKKSFLALKTLEDVAGLLEVTPRELRFYLFRKKEYKEFKVIKKSGGIRNISSPSNSLKLIQRKLGQVLHAVYGSRSPVRGFVRRRSIKSNARCHVGSEWILNLDLKDFFSSINFGRVRGLLTAKPYCLPEEAAQTVAQICCHNKSLPTGAPTSPIMANLVCGKLDSALKDVARRHGCRYTRYADDITISTKSRRLAPAIAYRDPQTKMWSVGDEITNLIKQSGFAINPQKTRVRGRHSRQEVTGVIVNSRLNVSPKLLRQARSMLHAWETFGEDAAQAEFWSKYDKKQRLKRPPPFRAVLRGKIEFIGFVRGRDDSSYIRLLQRLLALDPSLRSKPIEVGPETHRSVISQAIWLLYNDNDTIQGTAFAIKDGRLLTAEHNLWQAMWASRPGFDATRYPVQMVSSDPVRDVAELAITGRTPVIFRLGDDSRLAIDTPIAVVGFPHYHKGDSAAFRDGRIVQLRHYLASIPHFIVDADIVFGNSGGPVLNAENEAVGIAVKGVEVPGTIGPKDQLSSFIPIGAINFMKPPSPAPSGMTANP